MTNREWLKNDMGVTDITEVFNYMMLQNICLSPWYNGLPINCPFIGNQVDCVDCFNAWLDEDYYEGIDD